MDVLDHGYVNLIESWGSDEIIIESARMSTGRGFKGWGHWYCSTCETGFGGGSDCPLCQGQGEYKSGDERLLRYLWEHKHHSPFEMGGLTVEVQAPIFVFREWHRHRTQSYNELSARYTELPDLYYTPSISRLMAGKQSSANKQGSEGGFTEELARKFQIEIELITTQCRSAYELLLANGVSRELARLVIPVNQYSRMRASANLRNWLAFLSLRMDPAAQFEIREYANTVGDIIKDRFPRTWELFTEGKQDGSH